MGRLIDADKLIDFIRDDECPCMLQTALLNIIKAQSTAYDVDSVVEQLKEETVIGADCTGRGFECIPSYKAVDIVKGGGIDADDWRR